MPKVNEVIAHNRLVPQLIALKVRWEIIQGEPAYTVAGSSFQGKLRLDKADISALMLRAAADAIDSIDRAYQRRRG